MQHRSRRPRHRPTRRRTISLYLGLEVLEALDRRLAEGAAVNRSQLVEDLLRGILLPSVRTQDACRHDSETPGI